MRARNIKPGLFSNEILAATDAYTVLTFVGLFGLADREGRLEDRVARIHLQLHALRGVISDTEKALATLNDQNHIVRYEVEGQRYIWIPRFTKHQRPHVREAVSIIPKYHPAPSKDEPRTIQGIAKDEPRTIQGALNPESGFGSPLNDENGSSESGFGSPPASTGANPSADLNPQDVESAKKVIREPRNSRLSDHELASVASMPIEVIREAKRQIRGSNRCVQ